MGSKNKKPKTSNPPRQEMGVTDISKIGKTLVISYKYLDTNNKKYSMNSLSDSRLRLKYTEDFNEKMKEYCNHEDFKKEIFGRYGDVNRIHRIDWGDNRIRENGFTSLDSNLFEQIKYDCWQLRINNETFRVHGFFIENVFYIVWLDPLHNLYYRK